MKTVYKFLTLGAMMASFVFVSATASFAQADDAARMEAYQKFLLCYKEADATKKDACYTAAKTDFLDKFSTPQDEYYTFVKKRYDTYTTSKVKDALFTRFNNSIKDANAVNSDEAFGAGKEIWAANPDLIDVPIILASIGFDNAAAKTPNDKFNNDAINYAKTVIQQLDAGKTSTNYGANAWSFKNKDNTIGWMNYTIGYIMYNRMSQKKEALPYLYKATMVNSDTKSNPAIYQAIGNWYVDEFVKLDTDRTTKVKAAGDKDTDETIQILALQKGYAERAADAFARAYKVANNDAANAAYKNGLLTRSKELYGIRFNKDMSGYDAYLAAVSNKTFTDPTTAVTPVVEAAPATTTTGTTPAAATTMTNTSNNAAAPTTSRPANTSTTSSSVKSTSTTTEAAKTTTTTPAKKPAPKKNP